MARWIDDKERHGRTLEPGENASVAVAIGAEHGYYCTTTGACDCGTSMGAAARDHAKAERVSRSQIEKLRKKGWSQSKIDRWMSDKRKAKRKKQARFDALTTSSRGWPAGSG